MSELIGIIMVVTAVGLVGWPLISREEQAVPLLPSAGDAELAALLLQKESTFSTLSEMEEDYIMGNLSESDYSELKQKYQQKAIAVMKELDAMEKEQAEQIEQEIMDLRHSRNAEVAARSCSNCGAELDPDDGFCPKCGKAAGRSCPGCGAPIDLGDPERRFCNRCGERIN